MRGIKLKRPLSGGFGILGGGGQNVAEKGEFVSERRVDLSLSTSMRVNERRGSSRKLLNQLGGRFFIIS